MLGKLLVNWEWNSFLREASRFPMERRVEPSSYFESDVILHDEASPKSWYGTKETILRKESLELFKDSFLFFERSEGFLCRTYCASRALRLFIRACFLYF